MEHVRSSVSIGSEVPADAARELLTLAQRLASETPGFFDVKGPGRGNHATNMFINSLRRQAEEHFGGDHAEQNICGSSGFCVDYYFPNEATIVEIALGLKKPNTEFEKDVWKAVLAQEAGNAVSRLVFISKPGAIAKCQQPGRAAIIQMLERQHGIAVEVHELAPPLSDSGNQA